MNKKKIGIITGGGDCPGLNSAIRAIVKTAINIHGYEVVGFKDGYKGLVYNSFRKLALEDVSGLLDKGGTILGTTNSFDPFNVTVDHDGEKQVKDMSGRILDTVHMHELEGIIIIGGVNTITIADKLAQKGIKIIALPKTIENDISGTDYTIGFNTAVNTATTALDKLHSTAEAHHRVMVLGVMGRQAGWISLESGIAGGADIILIPEIPYDINMVARSILQRKNSGKSFSIVCVAEGCRAVGEPEDVRNITDTRDTESLNGIGNRLDLELEKLINLEVRVAVLGYLQRGGEPSSFDRILTTRLGVEAVNMAAKGDFNKMAGIKNQQVTTVKLSDVAGQIRLVPEDHELVKIARNMGVSFGD